jgi:DNA-directed RNA polymerase II subunit RPB3
VPNRFYFNVETAGSMPADAIVTEGIKVLQMKLAGLVHNLSDEGDDGEYNGPRSPEYAGGGDGWGQDQGFTTPYGNGGNQSAWGGAGGTTPYGTTPYGAGTGSWP